MALSYGFFNAELTQSGQYDRVYAAEQFAEYFHLIVSNGVFPDPATQLQVVASNTPDMNVNVSDGYGWINGYFAKNEGSYPLAVQAASGTLNRVDAVVLRWVNASRSMELAVKTGTPASSPVTPIVQRDTDVYELMLATVTVAAGATSIPQSAITDKRADTSVCGWVTGAVQNIDTTNLFAQYDAAFQAWFEDIKAQLEGNVATNLQNQINQNKQSIQTQANYVSDLKTGVKNTFDVGGIFLMSDAYQGEIVDAIPCNGGVYSPLGYPDLFSLIGYKYGIHLPVSKLSPLRPDAVRSCMDPVTGNIYIAVGSTVYVYNQEGALIRTGTPYSSLTSPKQITAYNNVVALYSADSGSNKIPCVSKDGGLTWTYSTTYTMGNAGDSTCVGICGDFVYFGVSFTSGTYGARYQISTEEWSRTGVWMKAYWYTTSSRTDLAFGNNNGILYKMNSSGAWTSCDISLKTTPVYHNGGVIIGNYLYTVNSSGNLIKVNSSGALVYTYTDVNFTGLACAIKVDDNLLFFDYGTTEKVYVLLNGSSTLQEVTLASGVASSSYFEDCTIVDSNLVILTRDSYRYRGPYSLNFQVPNISLDKTVAYIRTQAHKGV